ncbi:hypothetical protein PSTG_09719 [Puccinia striiformis f. sp. tritici PST-78]|uniref:Uncharacterized protein n=2 Tax=Puccinia striiformis f. sp. tritici TaxID=168172 RepID=A0A0L0VCH0_9BASI|nr:hypothetical protein PSTG_09719 [Puccinia striiformis f. sp. tritici PST-78]
MAKKKQEEKAAITRLRLAEKAAQAARLKWSEESLLELCVNGQRQPRYHTGSRCHALMGTWRQVKDYVDRSGSGGLFAVLVEFGLSLSVIVECDAGDAPHNPAATAHGQGDIEDDIGELCDEGMSDTTIDESTVYLPDELLDEVPRTCVPRRSRRGRNPDDVLTPKELVLDRQSSPPLDAHPLGLTTPATSLAPGAINPAAPDRPIAHPPAVPAASRSIPHRRGRTEESPKKDDSTGAGMLMMMQKSAEQTNMWMMEERKRAEDTRVEDCWDAEAKAALKGEICNEQQLLMKQERKDALEQAHQDRKAADDRAALAEQVRKGECQDAIEACREDTRRYWATQLK